MFLPLRLAESTAGLRQDLYTLRTGCRMVGLFRHQIEGLCIDQFSVIFWNWQSDIHTHFRLWLARHCTCLSSSLSSFFYTTICGTFNMNNLEQHYECLPTETAWKYVLLSLFLNNIAPPSLWRPKINTFTVRCGQRARLNPLGSEITPAVYITKFSPNRFWKLLSFCQRNIKEYSNTCNSLL